jgi:hypothetical protein
MSGHTVVVVDASLGFEDCEHLTNLLRLPVSAFYHMEAPNSGGGCSHVAAEDAEQVADTLEILSELVLTAGAPDVADEKQLRVWAKSQVSKIGRLLKEAEDAINREDDTLMGDTAYALADATRLYAAGLRGYDASQE